MRGNVLSSPALGEAGGEGLINGGVTGKGYVLAQVATAGGVYVFSPSTILDGTVSYGHDPLELTGHDYGMNFALEVLGIPGTNRTDIRQSGQPRFEASGYAPWRTESSPVRAGTKRRSNTKRVSGTSGLGA